MRILLLQPRVGDMDYVRSAPHYPLGLVHAAALAAERHDCLLLDERVEPRFDARLAEELARADLVAITAMSGSQVAHACRIARFARAGSQAPIVWGGIHPSALPDQVIGSALCDFVVRGEGEAALASLADAIGKGVPLDAVPSLSWKKEGVVVHNPHGPHADLDALPSPPWALADPRAYAPGFAGRPTLNLETSRGCPRDCVFCYNLSFNRRRWRALSPARVLERIGHLAGMYGIRGFYLTDDNFFADRARAFAIVRGIVDRGLDLRFQLQGVEVKQILAFTDGELDLLARAGCNRFSVGAESGSPRVLAYLGKDLAPADIVAANRRMRRVPIVVYYSFVSGFPGETVDDLHATIDLALRLTAENGHARSSPIYNYFPLPGTPLYDRIVREAGYVPPARLEDWAAVDYGAVNVAYVGGDLRRALGRAYIPSLFMDDKFGEYSSSGAFRLAARAYRPVARARLSHRFFSLPLERAVYRAYLRARGEARGRGGTQT